MAIKKIFKYRLWTSIVSLLLLLTSINLIGQNNQTVKGTQISDGTVLSNTQSSLNFSILDLNSSERGFVLPRLSTQERSAIPLKDIQPGLMVFNTTIDCVEFFSATRQLWLSLCGDENEPAEVEITNSGCNNIVISGNYAEKVFLQPRANTINLQVSVSVAGSYQIEAEAFQKGSNTPNGYSFYASGVFPSAGIYNVVLKGSGTPKKGYPRNANGTPSVAGDDIRFVLNGSKSNCVAHNFVNQVGLKYDFTINQTTQKIYKGNDITSREDLLTAEIFNITSSGKVEVIGVLENGISFKGSRYLTESEIVNKKASLKLVAQGKANIAMTTVMSFKSNSFVDFGIGEKEKVIKHDVRVELVNIDALCNNSFYPFKVNGQWEVNKPFTNHNIELPIRVTAPGRGVFKARTGDVVFTSDVVDLDFNSQTNDMMYVILKPEKNTPNPKNTGEQKFIVTFDSNAGRDYDISYPIEKISKVLNCPEYIVNVKGKAEFNFTGSTLNFWSQFISKEQSDKQKYMVMYFPPKMDMSSGTSNIRAGVTLKVNVLSSGEYDFATNEINGIKFVAKGVIDKIGIQEIILVPEGKSLSDLPIQTYRLFKDGQATNLTVGVDFVYQPMKMYSIGGGTSQSWHPGGNKGASWDAGPSMVRALENFGWNGKVRIDKLEIIGLSNPQASGSGLNNISDMKEGSVFDTNLNQADIVFIGADDGKGFFKSQNSLTSLANYIKAKKGAVVYGEDGNNMLQMTTLIKLITNQNVSATSKGGGSTENNNANRIVSASNEVTKLILGEEGKHFYTYGNVTLQSKLLGQGYNGRELFTLDRLPIGFSAIAYLNNNLSNSNTNVFSFVHNEYGFVGVGGAGFMGGYRDRSSTNTHPAQSIGTYTPNTTKYAGGEVYNSWFLLNLVHWSIDYAQEHRNKKY